MSEFINNREFRVEAIKKILAQLHAGKTVEEVKGQFAEAFEGVTAEEISQAEQALVNEGLPVEEIQNLCDVHAEVFKGSIQEIHRGSDPAEIPGHPANTLKLENRALEKLIDELRREISDAGPIDDRNSVGNGGNGSNSAGNGSNSAKGVAGKLVRLYSGLDTHYKKKENLFFPYMEQYGISAPPKVMWGVDDEIRGMLKDLIKFAENGPRKEFQAQYDSTFNKITDMIFKEENILLGILLENLTQDEWKRIADDSGELGYCLIDNADVWVPGETASEAAATADPGAEKGDAGGLSGGPSGGLSEGLIQLPTGSFTIEELTNLLNTLPIDITFVGKDDTVRYFSQSNERIFPRTPSVIGRQVSNCHPPASVHIVEKLVEDFKNGVKSNEDFWIHMGDKFILIRYFAVRDDKGEYLGVLEVTQNIAPIQELSGEKRLVSD